MLELIQKGGPVMWIIVAASVAALVIFLERLFHLHRAQINSDDFLEGIYNVLKRRNIVEAVSICEDTPGPVAHMVRAAILKQEADPEELHRALQEAGLAEVPRLERNLPILATIAQIAPLLGLLGTILGLIQAFIVFQEKAPLIHAGDLAGGMWEALITTGAGLAVAIPAYVAYNFLVGRVESIMLEMEHASAEILKFLTRQLPRKENDPYA